MRMFKVIALSVGALGNKIFTVGEVQPETAWRPGTADELVKKGFLVEEKAPEPEAAAPDIPATPPAITAEADGVTMPPAPEPPATDNDAEGNQDAKGEEKAPAEDNGAAEKQSAEMNPAEVALGGKKQSGKK